MKTVGYKAMLSDMTCRGYQFEVGKTYTIDNDKPLELCSDSGFHFCLNLEDIFNYYPYDNCRLFEVETDTEVVTGDDKSITKTLTIKRELTQEDFNNYQFENKLYSIYFKGNYTDEDLLQLKDSYLSARLLAVNKMRDLDLMCEAFKDDISYEVRKAVLDRRNKELA